MKRVPTTCQGLTYVVYVANFDSELESSVVAVRACPAVHGSVEGRQDLLLCMYAC